jgi:hypothetical protein
LPNRAALIDYRLPSKRYEQEAPDGNDDDAGMRRAHAPVRDSGSSSAATVVSRFVAFSLLASLPCADFSVAAIRSVRLADSVQDRAWRGWR